MQHKVGSLHSVQTFNLCSSSDIPKVVTTNAWVSPLVNNADPCVLGSTPTSHSIFLTSDNPLPSILFFVL